ncbi:MAG: hypothetical protein AB8H79_07485 [Myxococcota bacterium]
MHRQMVWSVALIMGGAGCGNDGFTRSSTVWSDDDDGRASLIQEYFCTSGLLGGNCRESGETTLELDGRELKLDFEPKEVSEFHFTDVPRWMRSEGYLMVTGEEEWAKHIVDDETGETLWSTESFGRALPSMDGRFVAVISQEESTLEITFREARTGEVEHAWSVPFDSDVQTLGPMRFDFPDWLHIDLGDRLIIVEPGDDEVGQGTERCWLPMTSSSAWNEDGKNADGEDSNDAGHLSGSLRDGWCPHSINSLDATTW